ncbi:MAG TPA: FtsX-like permease family protein [Opitutaceae bacterium]|nr:FtsX-like permease family protein [Opitutaceae bacterium]
MTTRTYIVRSLSHYRFAYLGVFAGAILGATVLLGALFAGDSVAASLRRIGELRVGRATHALAAGDRFFRQELAEAFARSAQARATPVLYARGTAAQSSGPAVANQVQLIGVTPAFWQFAPTPKDVPLTTSGVAINTVLARRLNAAVGDTIVVRLQKPGIVAGNAPVAGGESTLQSLRCSVAAILDDDSFGRFSLDTTQVAAPSVFLPIARLQEAFNRTGKANLLLVDASTRPTTELERALPPSLRLADYGLALKWLEQAGVFEITSDRVFIDPPLADAIAKAVAAQPVLSYLVNEFRVGERATPYSIATATTHAAAPFLPADLGPRDIVLNDWLARDLQASVGADVRLAYFRASADGAVVEHNALFRVRAIVPLRGLAADRAWMPDFPGISDVDRPGDWDPGLPLDLSRIREQDEKYWDEFRGAPKAFLSAAAGREIWGARWGDCTALRIPFAREKQPELESLLLAALRPGMNQLVLRNLRASAESAATPTVDFGGLFIGMSFFLIAAALGLVAMLFQFCVLQRNREDALLGALGLTARQLLRWRLGEACLILIAGTVAGLPLAVLYTRGVLRFLESIWAGQGGGSTFVFAARPASIATGIAIFLVLSLIAIALAIRRQTRRALSIRLAAQVEDTTSPQKVRRTSIIIAVLAGAGAVAALASTGRALPAQGSFYLAGFSLLVAGIAVCRAALARRADAATSTPVDPGHLARLNLQARRSRSLTVVGLIATAVFMVLSVASFRKHIGDDWRERPSGTGGFAFWVETTSPQNPARDGKTDGFEIFEADAAQLTDIVPLRAGVGDNANCFNLNTTSQPRLLAVNPARLADRGAFSLKLGASEKSDAGWKTLSVAAPDGAIPALVDETTLMWALKRKVGHVLAYTDENGRAFNVRIAGTIPDSLFQGYLIVDEQRFLERFPSHAGYSIFLVDAREGSSLDRLRLRLESAVADAGGRVDLTRDVLASFHQIENTYIAIFNVLGSLGVILGSLGLAIVVARNLRERRGEFAVMTAIGIPRAVLVRIVFSEFGRVVLWGIAIGVIASALAVWPGLRALPAAPTVLLVASLLGGIVALNLASGWLVFRWSLRDLRPSVVQG